MRTTNTYHIETRSGNFFVDNVTVRNVVDVFHPLPFDMSVEISEDDVTQGEDVLVSIQARDDYGVTIPKVSVNISYDGNLVEVREVSWGTYEAVLDTSELTGTVELIVTADKTGFIHSESIHQFMVIAPASFDTRNLSIKPSSVQIGETVEITVEVINEGGQEGSHLVELKINEVVEDEYVITLDPDSSDIVIFEYTPTQADKYTVAVNDLTGSFTVTQEVEEIITETEGPLDWIPDFPIVALVLGILFTVIFFTQRKQ